MSHSPKAAVIIIGNEVLSGKIADANGPFLIHELRARGVQVVELRVVSDDAHIIASSVQSLQQPHTHLFTTGGIGPTHDDVTIAGIALAFGVPVVRCPELEEPLRAHYGARLTEAHLKMAEIPEGARVLLSPESVVPTVIMKNVTVLPGVPSLMRTCFARIAENLVGTPFTSKVLYLSAFESDVAGHLDTIQKDYPSVSIGSYPRFDAAPFRVKVTLDGQSAGDVAEAFSRLRSCLPKDIIVGASPPIDGLANLE